MKGDQTYASIWKAPSNLAIVKYWGKKGLQEPLNPSISFSLSEALTTTKVVLSPFEGGGFSFKLNDREEKSFNPRIQKFLDNIRTRLPFIEQYHLEINSRNTFPHSSGIASSASAMCALAFCLADLQQQVNGGTSHLNIQEVSSLARLGSGSGARSVFGGWSLWGRSGALPESSDHYAVPLEVSPLFRSLHDDVLIVDSSPKPVSSSKGHDLMINHPYREARIEQAHHNTLMLLKYLQSDNMEGFIEIAETEALSLHGLMMSSSPPYTLLHPNSLSIIKKVRDFREKSGIPVTFTLDAGPNIHLLYPDENTKEVSEWEQNELKSFCEKGQIINDQAGKGPGKIIETNP